MAKYSILKAERDDAIARAVEAERNSNLLIVRELEERLALVTTERDDLAERLRLFEHTHAEVADALEGVAHAVAKASKRLANGSSYESDNALAEGI